jgi:hypothetical protein
VKNEMRKQIILFALVVLLFSACNSDDNSNFRIETLPIKEATVPNQFEFGKSYDLSVIYDLPNGCYSFYDLYYQYDGPARIVAVNSIVNSNLACTEALITQQFNFVVQVSQLDDYTFKFWKGEDELGNDLFEEITVPVIGP